ncbi:extracellular solute-binding protein [Bifidobacterium oedipodis]|uniref:Periplasmic binding protein-like domain-containing protein n=1 Tax=Bifidobacterium oedipodis TaxID=2675322 RepID=A0A7Y0HS80_9BIFI|nr:extracellular solute-binding protein [Bifidobacterium sp. DSM 109957]NMM93721.1 Periplasmic binding protein-like domain-containing protein [Bifidobacterium sp. DSM 109957]
MNSSRNVTLAHIAQQLGLSQSTVSRALSRTGRVSAATEARVRQAAQASGYVLPQGHVMIAGGATKRIAIITPSLNEPSAAMLAEHLQHRLAESGHEPLVLSTGGSLQHEHTLIHTWNSAADGFVLISPGSADAQIRRLAAILPTVVVDRYISTVSSVIADASTGITAAIKTLHGMGHSSITYVAGPSSWANTHRRRALWQAAMRAHMECRIIEDCPDTVNGGRAAFALYDQHRTDAVLTFNDAMAAGFITTAIEHGLRLPKDVSVIGYGDSTLADLVRPTMSSIHLPWNAWTDAIAAALEEQFDSSKTKRVTTRSVATRFIQRASIARKQSVPQARRLAFDSLSSLRSAPHTDLTLMVSSLAELQPALDAFAQRFPHIHLHAEESGPQASAIALLRNRKDADRNVPDLFRVEYDKLPELAFSGQILNFRFPRIEREFTARFLPQTLASVHVEGGLFGVPTDIAQMVMFCRTDMLNAANLPIPRTWRDYHDVGARLRERLPGTAMGFINVADAQHYLSLLRMAGAPLWTQHDATNIQLSLNAPEVVAAAKLLQHCIDDGVLICEPHTAHMTDGTIASGRYAAPVTASWFAPLIVRAHPNGTGLWQATLPPSFSAPEQLVTSTVGGSALVINADAPRDRQATALASALWLTSDPQSMAVQSLRNSPSAVSLYHDNQEAYAPHNRSESLPSDVSDDSFFGSSLRNAYIDSMQRLDTHWKPLPFMTQVDADFRDTILPELAPGGHSQDLLTQWQASIANHGRSLGFTVHISNKG